MLNATSEQLERLISTAQALEHHAREWADVLLDEDEDGEGGIPLFGSSAAEILADIAAFCAIRREIEGVQQALDMHIIPQEAP